MPRASRRHSKETFGQRLARLRRAAGLTQQQAADLTGVSRRMIAHYETQAAAPPTHVLPKLAEAFEVTVDELPRPRQVVPPSRRMHRAPPSTSASGASSSKSSASLLRSAAPSSRSSTDSSPASRRALNHSQSALARRTSTPSSGRRRR